MLASVDGQAEPLDHSSLHLLWMDSYHHFTEEQKDAPIQIECRVMRALAPVSSQNYSRSSTQSDLLRTFLLLLELLALPDSNWHRKCKGSGPDASEIAMKGSNHANFLCQLTNLFLISFTHVGGLPWALGIRRFLGSLNLSPFPFRDTSSLFSIMSSLEGVPNKVRLPPAQPNPGGFHDHVWFHIDSALPYGSH